MILANHIAPRSGQVTLPSTSAMRVTLISTSLSHLEHLQASRSMAPSAFPRFAELPTELQLQIWQQAVLALRSQPPYSSDKGYGPYPLSDRYIAHPRIYRFRHRKHLYLYRTLSADALTLLSTGSIPRLLTLEMLKMDIGNIVLHSHDSTVTERSMKKGLVRFLEREMAKLKG